MESHFVLTLTQKLDSKKTHFGASLVVCLVVENPVANSEGTGSIPGLGRSHMPQSN